MRHYTYDAFNRKVLKIFEEPDLTQLTSRELFEMIQGTWESLYDFMTRLQFLVTKSFPNSICRTETRLQSLRSAKD